MLQNTSLMLNIIMKNGTTQLKWQLQKLSDTCETAYQDKSRTGTAQTKLFQVKQKFCMMLA